jgi:eukaryotic-like serine/threonine-protein kinase
MLLPMSATMAAESVLRSGFRRVGRYALYRSIGSGGMATVHLGRLIGTAGFSRVVAIKRLHPQYARSPEFRAAFLDEARLAARVRHPNVLPTVDVVAEQDELFLVMEYVPGESLSRLVSIARERSSRPPTAIAAGIMAGVLHGLHAVHEATSERGEPLGLVHRDVSPQNVLVGTDGVPRVLDFGVAKAAGRVQSTPGGELKGKLSYMPPEQILEGKVDRRTDTYAAAVVLWEALTSDTLFNGGDYGTIVSTILRRVVEPPSRIAADVPPALDEIVMRGLDRDPTRRFATAREFALALEEKVGIATAGQVGPWVGELARGALARRAALLSELEREPTPAGVTIGLQLLEDGVVPEDTPGALSDRLGARRRRRLALVALGTLVIATAAVFAWPGRWAQKEAKNPVPRAAGADPPSVYRSAPSPVALPPPTAATPGASVQSETRRNVQRRAERRAGLKTDPGSELRPDCDPPYTVDDRGIQRLKRECL